jgi:hypothetical protein
MEQERCLTYEALLMQADGRWATADEIVELTDQPNLDGVLEGLVYMCELEMEMFDDGVPCFRLTDFGARFASGMVLGG